MLMMPFQSPISAALLLVALVTPPSAVFATGKGFTVVSTSTSTLPVTSNAKYNCEFVNMWSGTNHPRLYPEMDASWSPPVLASHDASYTMWIPGGMASAGIETVAEEGIPAVLVAEVNANAGVGDVVTGTVQFNRVAQSQVLPTVTVTADKPRLSSVSMVAPSPDWFSGFYNFDARDMDAGFYYQEFVIEAFPFDAGTEKGNRYKGVNFAQISNLPISQFTENNARLTKVFLNTAKDDVLPVLTYTCTLTDMDSDGSGGGGGRASLFNYLSEGFGFLQDTLNAFGFGV